MSLGLTNTKCIIVYFQLSEFNTFYWCYCIYVPYVYICNNDYILTQDISINYLF